MTGWCVCYLSEMCGSDYFCSIISMRLRCVYFRKLPSVSSNVISNNCLFVLDWKDMLLWTVIWMFSTRRDCQRVCSLNVTVYGVGTGTECWCRCILCKCILYASIDRFKFPVGRYKNSWPTPTPLIWSRVLSLYRLNPFGHNTFTWGFLNHLPLIQICKISCCQHFILLLSLIINSSSSLTFNWIAPISDYLRVVATSHFSDRLWRSYCDAGCHTNGNVFTVHCWSLCRLQKDFKLPYEPIYQFPWRISLAICPQR